jgi:hypothetical protein
MKLEFVPPAQCGGDLAKVKLYKARNLVEMTVARHPNLLEIYFGPFGYSEAVHRDKHLKSSYLSTALKRVVTNSCSFRHWRSQKSFSVRF